MKVARGLMTKPEYDRMLKDRFHEATQKKFAENPSTNTLFTAAEVLALIDMADNDVCPDGHFGDTDCNIWEAVYLIAQRKR